MATNPIDEAMGEKSSPDPFAAYGGHALNDPTSNPIDAAILKSSTTNPIDAALTKSTTDPFAALGEKSSPDPFAALGEKSYPDPFAAYGGHALNDPSATPPPPSNQMGEDKSWLTRPLSTLVGIPEYRKGAGGFERGAEKFVSGLTSPLSLGLLLVTGGVGSLAEDAGATALGELAPAVASKVIPAARTISRLAQIGFTGDQIYNTAQTVPRIGDAIRSGDIDTAKEMIAQTLLSGATAAMGARGIAKRYGLGAEPIWTGSKEVLGRYQNAAEAANVKAKIFEENNKALLKDTSTDISARLYHEAGGDTATLDQWRQDLATDKNIKPAIRDKWTGYIDRATNLPDNAKAFSSRLKADYAGDLQKLREMGKFDPSAEADANYSGTHTYEPNDEGASNLRPVGFKTARPAFTRARSFDTIVDAIKAGFEPTETGLTSARADYIRKFGQLEGITNAEDALTSQTAEDNRPLAVSPAQAQKIGGKTVVSLPAKTDVSTLPADSVLAKNGKLYLNVSDYRPGPDVFQRYRFRTLDENGNPVFDRAPALVHPEAATDVNRYFQDESAFRQMPLLNGLLKASSGTKKSLLSLSPFHWTTEYLRGLQMGLSPLEAFKPDPLTPDRPAVAEGTKYGLTLLGDSPARSMMAEGTAENAVFLKKVPGIGPLLSSVEDKLFSDYIPKLKAATYEKLTGQIAKRHANWNEQQVGTAAAQITNSAYGGLNWKQLGVSLSSQDALRLAFLAPDFGGSQLLFAKEGLGPNASVIGQSLGRIALYNFGVARVLNLLVNGQAHLEHPFGVVSPDDKKVFSVRTMPEDIWHGLSDPQGFAMNRMNPLLTRSLYEGLSGRNSQGQKVDGQRQVLDLLRNVTPISVQNFVPALRQGPDQTTGEGVLKALGVAEESNQTSAQKLAGQLSSDRMSSVALPEDQLAHYHLVTQLEDALRAGSISQEDIGKAIDGGEISFREEREILQNVRATKGLDPLTAKLVAQSNRLPMADLLRVYRLATPPERVALVPTLLKKKRAYIVSAYKDKTPAQRTADPTLRTITQMFTQR